MTVAAVAAGVGCCLAGVMGTKFLHGNYVDVIMSDDIEAIKEIHEFLTNEHIKHKVEETYNKDLTEKTLTITAFSDTLAKNRKLKTFIENSEKNSDTFFFNKSRIKRLFFLITFIFFKILC